MPQKKKNKPLKVKAWPYGRVGIPFFPDKFEIRKYNILQWTDVRVNHNKYYSIEMHIGAEGGKGYFRLFTHYGRTGDLETDPSSGRRECRFYPTLNDIEIAYNTIIEEKTTKKGYRKVELSTANIGSKELKSLAESNLAKLTTGMSSNISSGPSSLPPMLQELIGYLYEEATAQLTNSISARITARGIETPLGVLTMKQVLKGESVLDEILSLHADGNLDRSTAETLSGDFYTIIPHKLGRSKAAIRNAIIDNEKAFEQKKELLQLMKDMLSVNSTGALFGSGVDNKYSALRCDIIPLNNLGDEFNRIKRHVLDSQVKFEGISVKNIFSINRKEEERVFTRHINNQQLLFHGSRVSNWVGILSRGILMPKKVVSLGGKRTDYGLLGAGIYFGGNSCTSAQYCSAGSKGTRFMLLANVALGKVFETTKIISTLENAPSGFNSVRGVSSSHGTASDFDDDEYVIYDSKQQKQDYLVEFTLDKEPPKKNFGFKPPTKTTKPLTSFFSNNNNTTPFGNVLPYSNTTITPTITPTITTPIMNPFSSLTTTTHSPFTPLSSTSSSSSSSSSSSLFGVPQEASSYNLSDPAPYIDNITSSNIFNSITEPSSTSTSSLSSSYISTSPIYQNYDSIITSEQLEMKRKEDHFRKLFAEDRNNYEISNIYVSLLDVFNNLDTFIFKDETSEEIAMPKLLCQSRPSLSELDGTPSCVNKSQWIKNWDHFTQGIFKDLNWNNVFVAGGSVLSTMDPTFESKVAQDSAHPRGSDIDMFLYGLQPYQANAKLCEIFNVLQRNTKGKGDIVRTKHAITILGTYPYRHIQIILRLYKSPAEVLIGFDIDSCTVGFDGSKVWALPRARRAINKRYNLLDLSRRSLTYEVRLNKYSKRGFCVAIPGFEPDKVDSRVYSFGVRSISGLAKLIIMDRNATKLSMRKSPPRKYTKKKLTSILTKEDNEKEEKDYSDVHIPWGPGWYSNQIVSMLKTQDKAQFFSTLRRNKQEHTHKKITHIFVSGIDSVLNDTSRMGALEWLTIDPGRQLLTGSFHPVDDEHWVDDAYGLSEKVQLGEYIKKKKIPTTKKKRTPMKKKSTSTHKSINIYPVSGTTGFGGGGGGGGGGGRLLPNTSFGSTKSSMPFSFGNPPPIASTIPTTKFDQVYNTSTLSTNISAPLLNQTPDIYPSISTRIDIPAIVPSYTPSSDIEEKLQQVFKMAAPPKSPTAKLLLLISVLFKADKIDASERTGLKDLVISRDSGMQSALEVFEIERDFEELADTFKRLLKIRPAAW